MASPWNGDPEIDAISCAHNGGEGKIRQMAVGVHAYPNVQECHLQRGKQWDPPTSPHLTNTEG